LIKSDSQTAISLIESDCSRTHPCYGLVGDIKNLATQVTSIKFSQSSRGKSSGGLMDAMDKLDLSQASAT